MLTSLEILNGTLELEFNIYTYTYTIIVDDDVEELKINYIVEDNCNVDIADNYLDSYENYVYINVYNEEDITTYTLIVYKETSSLVNNIDEYITSLEVEVEETPTYQIQILCVSMFLLIVIAFSIIFRRKKN